jgi:general secretion pathway protein C
VRIALLLLSAALAAGCGGSLMDEPVENAASAPEVPDPTTGRVTPPPGSLFRDDVAATVNQGLGYFLQRVSVDAEVVDGKFHGFRIVELRPMEFWQGVDLRPGDVATQVNGMSIERDIDAYQAFQSLRTAPALRVTFTRGGAPHELVYSIIEPRGKSSVPKTKAAPAPGDARPKQSPTKASG